MSEEKLITKGENRPLRIRLVTFGCAMNYYDSEVAEGVLEAAGYQIVREDEDTDTEGPKTQACPPVRQAGPPFLWGDPSPKTETVAGTAPGGSMQEAGGGRLSGGKADAGDMDHKMREDHAPCPMPRTPEYQADIVLLNTCSVREHAEDRVFGRLGRLGKAKQERPDLVVGLMGCMVEEHREKLFKRFPQLDFMVGTRNIKDLPGLIADVYKRRKQVAKIQQDGISIEYTDKIKRRGRFHAWLPIMTGCDKECTFCIVPKTRGSEVSMPAGEVCREARRLMGEGVKWVTLLGQNVNSYSGFSDKGQVTGDMSQVTCLKSQNLPDSISFPQLLEMLCQIEGLERISFTTSHPGDATEELFQVIARNPKISRRFHLPLQSGSDRMLKRMKRLHTYEEYKQKIDLLRKLVPDVSLTTDMIAGFSGESVEDHMANVRALEEIRFDGAFIYKYSVRPGTPASKLDDDVPILIKEERLAELLKIQDRITTEENRRWPGRTVEVFVEDHSPKKRCEVLGRSREEKKVVFPGEASLLGTFQKVTILSLRYQTFVGELCRSSACAGECGKRIRSKN